MEELAEEFSVSRSTLLRTLKKHTGLSANQFIKGVRLEQAKVMLAESGKTIAEISFETGFSSPSYFIKCFKEKYGYSPGESRQTISEGNKYDRKVASPERKSGLVKAIASALLIITLITLLIFFLGKEEKSTSFSGQSIAVLPFQNQSADSYNVYFVNGMMEYILSHLQKIEYIRVISKTSVEKYRNSPTSIPEIATDLGWTSCLTIATLI
ncbi:MAG: helix-turn-helix domain-containing protein [Bacteroidota bacterium]